MCGCLFAIAFCLCAFPLLLLSDVREECVFFFYDAKLQWCVFDNVLHQSSSNVEISVSAPCDFAIPVCVLDDGTCQSSSNFAIFASALEIGICHFDCPPQGF